MTFPRDGDRLGPDDLAPGWAASPYTWPGQMQRLSLFTSGLRRPGTGWRQRMRVIAVLIVLAVILVPAALTVLSR